VPISHSTRPCATASGLERNRSGNLECIPLECRSAFKFAKILDAVVDVEIIDRPKLEEAACECYGLMQRQVKEWQKDVEQ
jgi:hypothetical protein